MIVQNPDFQVPIVREFDILCTANPKLLARKGDDHERFERVHLDQFSQLFDHPGTPSTSYFRRIVAQICATRSFPVKTALIRYLASIATEPKQSSVKKSLRKDYVRKTDMIAVDQGGHEKPAHLLP